MRTVIVLALALGLALAGAAMVAPTAEARCLIGPAGSNCIIEYYGCDTGRPCCGPECYPP